MRLYVVVISFILSVTVTAQAKVVSDELVKNLNCSNLTADSVYSAIDRTSFLPARRVMISNAQMDYHVDSYGDCWSIAHWQRLNLLLGRRAKELTYSPLLISNLIRGQFQLPGLLGVVGVGLTTYNVFEMPQDRQLMTVEGTLQDDLKKIGRDYWQDLHTYQKGRFYRTTNLYYVLTPRSQETSVQTLVQVAKLANSNRLPLVIMRFAAADQHVVLVTRALRLGVDNYRFNVIDEANADDDRNSIRVTRTNGNWDVKYVTWSSEEKVDIFLANEEERPMIDQALVDYYSARCSR